MRLTITAILSLFGLSTSTALAHQTVITNAVADVDAAPPVITIEGAHFGAAPAVFLGTMGNLVQVSVVSASDTSIVAELPTTEPGTYLLYVVAGRGLLKKAKMDVTLQAGGGDITAVGAGTGLTGGGEGGDVTLSVATDGINGAMIAGGAVSTSEVDATQIQLRVNGACASGESIRVINQDGSVLCEADDVGAGGVTAVTATAPLVSSGGTTPNISLPHVIIGPTNTAIGVSALVSNTLGFNNTASGASALGTNTTGSFNTASGMNSLRSNSTGFHNTANGGFALLNNTTGSGNTASGATALQNNTTGVDNTASGAAALRLNTTGNVNTASGVSALVHNTTGFGNTASGVNALAFNSTGDSNTASGRDALYSNTTGSNNTAIGAGANVSIGGLNNATAIGYNAIVNASNKVRLGNSAVTVIEGQVAFTAVSDRNQKENFSPLDRHAVLEKVHTIPVQSWNYIGQDPTQFRHYGPVAQDFFAAFGRDEVGTIGTPTTINSGDMEGILMSAVQALEERTTRQREEIERLKLENASLNARLEQIEHLLRSGVATVTGQ